MAHEFFALGTKWWVEIFDEIDSEKLETAYGSLELFTHEFENKYSRFKYDSLVSKLNRERTLSNPSEEFRTLLQYGKQLYVRTNTHFNLLLGNIQESRGYDANYSFTPIRTSQTTPANPITDLIIDSDKIKLRNGKLDIGGFGKGYLIDLLTDLLMKKYDMKYFFINGGGDIYATSRHDQPIKITLEHPTQPNHYLGKINIKNLAFAGSSPFKRLWYADGETYSHIISNNENPELASFVKAQTARDADAFATTALLATETELLSLAKDECLEFARYSPATSQLWHTRGFFNTVTGNVTVLKDNN